MVQECRDNDLSGEAFNKMVAEMEKMETYASEMDDVGEFSARLATEGCFNNFSQYYGEVLAQAAKAETTGENGDVDDDALLKQALQAHEDAIKRLEQASDPDAIGNVAADNRELIPAIQKVIELGKSGVTYPVFLRQCIEQGLDRAMEGAGVQRNALEADLKWAEWSNHPLLRQAGRQVFLWRPRFVRVRTCSSEDRMEIRTRPCALESD